MSALHDVLAVEAERLRGHGPTTFPPEPGCYGCGGTGQLYAGPCVCVLHEVGECEPDDCSEECHRRAELRGELRGDA